MPRATVPNRLQALRHILEMEAANGYANKAVAGGLDAFLARLASGAPPGPEARALADRGLLTVGYGDLTPVQRGRWAGQVAGVLQLTTPANRPAPTPAPAPAPRAPVAPSLDAPVSAVRGVTRPVTERLAKLGVADVRDMLFHFPLRHLDYSQRRTVAGLRVDEEQTLVAAVWTVGEPSYARFSGRQRRTEMTVGDETGNIEVVWFNQPWLAPMFQRAIERAGSSQLRIALAGKVTAYRGKRQFVSPEWDLLDDPDTAQLVNTGRMLPVYPSTDGLPQRTLRRLVRTALQAFFRPEGGSSPLGDARLPDPLPAPARERLRLIPLAHAVQQMHYPADADALERARRRIAFDELLVLQLAIATRRQATDHGRSVPLRPAPDVVRAFVASLPFQLTEGQQHAIRDGSQDMASSDRPMRRLLQGDVGSGKTVVAVALLLTAVADGYQGALMAPTEVLAEQHFLNIQRLFASLAQPARNAHWFSIYVDGHPRPISVGLLTGSTPARARRELRERAAAGTLDILLGTHALIQEGVEVPKLALAVVDEQHRFGVMQRAALRSRNASYEPHLLVMSATPIPRTLALTLYGDLDTSVMPELPAGRQQIKTRIVEPLQRTGAEGFVLDQVRAGRQAFIVCPLIEESEAVQARAATVEFERLRTGPFASVRVGLLHGRMPIAEKQAVMDRLRAGDLDVLVATPVIEVGIDVPNATVMLIEAAERFGLSQLHQLRGRVGRGAHQSYAFLATDAASPDARERLDVLVRSTDGFEIAEADLRLRGPGDFFGTRQSGLPALRVARLSDRDLLVEAREEAHRALQRDPALAHLPALAHAVQRYVASATDEVS